jgi:hypothetical protein
MKIQGPVDVELKISITNGSQDGVATITMGRGRFPTDQELRDRVLKFEREEMPEGFRLMAKREYWDSIVPPTYDEDEDGNRVPMRFAMPGGADYDA